MSEQHGDDEGDDIAISNTPSEVSPRHPGSPDIAAAVKVLQTKYRNKQHHSTTAGCASETNCPFDYSDNLFVELSRRTMRFLHEAWLDQTLCDLTLITADGNILMHKTVMASSSSTLNDLYRQQEGLLQQAGHDHTAGLAAQLDLSEFSMEPVADVANFTYTGSISLDNKNIGPVTACSTELGIGLLIKICRKYLLDACDPHNIILHYSVAANNDFNDIRDRLLTVICEAFPEVSRFVKCGRPFRFERYVDVVLNQANFLTDAIANQSVSLVCHYVLVS